MGAFKSYFTYLSRNRLFTVVNVLGLSVSLMFVLLIGNMVAQQMSEGRSMKESGRTYVLTDGRYSVSHILLGDMLTGRYPEMEEWSWTFKSWTSFVSEGGDNMINVKAMAVTENFFTFFGIPLVQGDAEQALVDEHSVVLTREAANRLFGTEDVMGRTLSFSVMSNGKPELVPYTVTGVADGWDRTLFEQNIDLIFPYEIVRYENYYSSDLATGLNGTGGTDLFVRFAEGADPAQMTDVEREEMREWLNGRFHAPRYEALEWVRVCDVYFSEIGFPTLRQYSLQSVVIFIIVGVVILLMAVLNYVSMSVAQAAYRVKEMATRRLLGSARRAVFWRMVGETLIMTVISFLLGFLLALVLEPQAEELMGVKIGLVDGLNATTVAVYIVAVCLIALLAGTMPAVIVSGYDPLEVMKGAFRRKTRMVWLRTLFVVQSGVAVALLGCAFFLTDKIGRLLERPVGYTYDNVAVFNNVGQEGSCNLFRDRLRQLPYVESVSFASGLPATAWWNNTIDIYTADGETKQVAFNSILADSAFFGMFGIEVLEDYHVAQEQDGSLIYLTESAYREIGHPRGITSIPSPDYVYKVAGCVTDFTLGPVGVGQGAPAVSIHSYDNTSPAFILVKTTGEEEAYMNEVEEIYRAVTHNVTAEGYWYRTIMERQYSHLIRLGKLIGIFTATALLITLLGLTAMSLYFIAQRKRDMAIRKVFGSDARRELLRLMRFAMTSLAVGLLIAVPLMWAGIRQIDRIVEYDMPFPWWVALAAFAIVAAVSLLSVWLISRHAVRENPVENLKTE